LQSTPASVHFQIQITQNQSQIPNEARKISSRGTNLSYDL